MSYQLTDEAAKEIEEILNHSVKNPLFCWLIIQKKYKKVELL